MKTSTDLHSGWYPGGSYVYSQLYLPYGYDPGDISDCDGELVDGDCGYWKPCPL
jgi:hypothetical protein